MTGAAPASSPLIELVGQRVRPGVEWIGAVCFYVGDVARAFGDWRTWLPEFGRQALSLGVHSMPVGVFIALFSGVVLSLLAGNALGGAVPPYLVGALVQKTITMELAPVLTGLVLAGRVGANIAAEVGTMRVTEQIDALETLRHDPYGFICAPRVLAGVLMFPVVVAAAMVAGLGAGWGASIALLDLSTADYVKGMRLFFDPPDVVFGLVKAVSFGAAVTLIGCRMGMGAAGGARGVGDAATKAVVHSAVVILVLDVVWALLWLSAPR